VTWGSGTLGLIGTISEDNSLVGSNSGDQVGSDSVTLLTNGNYVVQSSFWNGFRGAVTWADGTTGIRGIVSDANSFIGNLNDHVGSDGVTPLSNGNFVVGSPSWNGNRGAVTWGSGTLGLIGTISEDNSLVGGDGYAARVTPLTNGNYVVQSPGWNSSYGAVTWGDGTAGAHGIVSEANSLIGSNLFDRIGFGGIIPLSNGNYVVQSPVWNNSTGAVTWGDGTVGVHGIVSEANSLIGCGVVSLLSNGNYVARGPSWNGDRGAVTWGSGTVGVVGAVSASNSLVGSNPGDYVGLDGISLLSNGNYVILSSRWNGDRGAVTWGSGNGGLVGTVSDANSLVGSNPNDWVGTIRYVHGRTSGVTPLTNGNYLVLSGLLSDNRGAVTWVDGTTGQTLDRQGVITAQNSLVGDVPSFGLTNVNVVMDPVHQSFVISFSAEGTGRTIVALFDPNQLTYARAQAQTITVTPDFLTHTLNSGGAVILQASNNITINSAITVSTGASGGALTLQAGRSILINANITTDNGALTLIANDQLANGVIDAQRDPGNAVIIMAPGTALDTGTGALTIELRNGDGKTYADSGAITLQTLTAGTLSVTNNGPTTGSDVILGMVTTAGAQTYASPNGTTVATDNLATTASPVTFNTSVSLNAGLTLNVGASTVIFAGGTVTPNPGVFSIAGSLALASSTSFSALLNGTDPTSYSQITASGSIDLGSSTLALTLGFTPDVGDSFTLLTAGDGSSITGTFAGLDEGATFSQGDFTFQITYQGGPNGNSVVLTRVS
jgi:hypothetical protein